MQWLIPAVLVVLAGVWLAYLIWYFSWEARHTRGMAYYGRPLAERRALKARMRRMSAPVRPLVALLARLGRSRATMPGFEFEGVAGPARVSSPEAFRRARDFVPGPGDVFVATQMRSGTTWMQQTVHEIVCRGRGDLTDVGLGHLYAMSPWIDGLDSVPMDDAPRIGSPPVRLIKTHLPADLCPWSADAKYIYVARHPVACFASILEFNRSLGGPAAPPVEAVADWFCSDRMYWRPWPQHVAGWWEWAEGRPNVLFVHFEEMKADFDAVRDRVAAFLGVDLTPEERARVSERCSFAYMKAHEEVFEMAPPTMYSVAGGRFVAGGRASRDDDVPPDIRQRILVFCRSGLTNSSYPAGRMYPDLAGPAHDD